MCVRQPVLLREEGVGRAACIGLSQKGRLWDRAQSLRRLKLVSMEMTLEWCCLPIDSSRGSANCNRGSAVRGRQRKTRVQLKIWMYCSCVLNYHSHEYIKNVCIRAASYIAGNMGRLHGMYWHCLLTLHGNCFFFVCMTLYSLIFIKEERLFLDFWILFFSQNLHGLVCFFFEVENVERDE